MALHLDAALEIVEPAPGRVLPVSLEYQTNAYDAVYVVLALDLGIPLLTAERSTTPWVRKLGKRVQIVS